LWRLRRYHCDQESASHLLAGLLGASHLTLHPRRQAPDLAKRQ
jgi:hypothetical protein